VNHPASAPLSLGRHRWNTALDGQRLRQLRRQHDLSQEHLAAKAGISLATVARLERTSRTTCRTRTLARLAAALGEPPAALTPGGPS
jgi:transcriptional regulator with XRE-family HTH domain